MENRGTHGSRHRPTVTGALWLALLKFSSGEWNVTAAERDALLAYGLIQEEEDGLALTPYGRQVLEQSA
jgi:hypothetical protein